MIASRVLIAIGIMMLGLVLAPVLWVIVGRSIVRWNRRRGKVVLCPPRFGWMLNIRPGRWFRRRTLQRSGVCDSEIVLELGAGNGTFTGEIARLVGEKGRVLAFDIQSGMTGKIVARLAAAGVTDVWIAVADGAALPLRSQCIDRVLLISVLGELADPGTVLDELHRVTRPGAVVSISEEFFDPDYRPPREVSRLMLAHAFVPLARHGGPLLYTQQFRRS